MKARFDEPVRIDQIRGGKRIELNAEDDELRSVANRLGLEALERLEAHAALDRKGEVIRAEGRVQASLTQRCVVTGDPIATFVDAPFDLAFTPAPQGSGADCEIELGTNDCDTVFHDGAAIDLGGAIADTLTLSIDPYPRSAGAEAALREAGVMSEAEASPFAALAALKGKLGGET